MRELALLYRTRLLLVKYHILVSFLLNLLTCAVFFCLARTLMLPCSRLSFTNVFNCIPVLVFLVFFSDCLRSI